MSRRAATAGLSRSSLPWTGQLDLEVGVGGSVPLGTVELVFRREFLDVHFHGRLLASVDRDELRLWLSRPSAPYRVDDITLEVRSRTLHLALDQAPADPLPGHVEERLRQVI